LKEIDVEAEKDTNNEPKRKISTSVTDGFVIPLKQVVHKSSPSKSDTQPQTQKVHPVLSRRKKGENGVEIVQEIDTGILLEGRKKSANFSFGSFEDMQANAPKHRSGEYQRIIGQYKNSESL